MHHNDQGNNVNTSTNLKEHHMSQVRIAFSTDNGPSAMARILRNLADSIESECPVEGNAPIMDPGDEEKLIGSYDIRANLAGG